MRLLITLAAAVTIPLSGVGAQGHGHHDEVPPGQLPPAGQCRIWFDSRPPGHQPLPMDCQTAFRDAPPDARVLVGEGVDSRAYDHDAKDHGEHRGWDKGHGNKHGDRDDDDADRDESRRASAPSGDCLAYTPEGRCAEVYAPAGGPQVLPDMIGAVFASEGRDWPEVQRWLGGMHLTVHVDATIGGRPTRVRWLDSQGRPVQERIDPKGDGRAHIVRIYRQGVLVRTYGP